MSDADNDDNMDGFSVESLIRIVHDALVREELDSLAKPHLVVIKQGDGQATYEGPYADAMTALVVATQREREFIDQGEWQESPDDLTILSVGVAPVLTPGHG